MRLTIERLKSGFQTSPYRVEFAEQSRRRIDGVDLEAQQTIIAPSSFKRRVSTEAPMTVKTAASTLIVTALAVIGDYSSVPRPAPEAAPHRQSAKTDRFSELRVVITELCNGWNALDSVFSEATVAAVKQGELDNEKFLRNSELLSAIRVLEATLRDAVVPQELSADHLALRRAIAGIRSRLATLDIFYRQFFTSPDEFPSEADPIGLKALADHTTRRLDQLS